MQFNKIACGFQGPGVEGLIKRKTMCDVSCQKESDAAPFFLQLAFLDKGEKAKRWEKRKKEKRKSGS